MVALAIGELLGAAAFVTTVVLGLVAIIQPFPADPSNFIGDKVWFIIAVSMLVAFLVDGSVVLEECLGIIALYIAFVCFALLRPKLSAVSTRSEPTFDNFREHQRLTEALPIP